MKSHFKRLAALISLSLTQNGNAVTEPTASNTPPLTPGDFILTDLNISVSQLLAGHRSHGSHASHGSHRSSSSGSKSYRTPSKPSPVYTPTPAPRPKPQPQYKSNESNQADPLGQQARPLSSYPSTQTQRKIPTKKKELQNIIMRMQLTLQFDGYYDGRIDGIMGPKTRDAINEYKSDKGIYSSSIMDAETLNALGIKGF